MEVGSEKWKDDLVDRTHELGVKITQHQQKLINDLRDQILQERAAVTAARDRVLEALEKAADDSGIPNEAGGFTLAADIVRREMGGK